MILQISHLEPDQHHIDTNYAGDDIDDDRRDDNIRDDNYIIINNYLFPMLY